MDLVFLVAKVVLTEVRNYCTVHHSYIIKAPITYCRKAFARYSTVKRHILHIGNFFMGRYSIRTRLEEPRAVIRDIHAVLLLYSSLIDKTTTGRQTAHSLTNVQYNELSFRWSVCDP